MPNNNETDVKFLEDFLEQNPESIIFARLADVYLKMDKVETAAELCEEGIKKHPYYATGHFVLGKCYLAKKQYELAEKEFKRVLLFDPKFLAAHKYYGDLMKEIGWENTCETSYKKILQIDPLDEVARSIAGEYILEGSDLEEQTDSFEPPIPDMKAEADKIAPMSVSPEEEEMLFEADEAPEDTEQKISEIEGQVAQIDEEKAEEFSYILDDIFKDEVVEEEKDASPPSIDEESSDDTMVDFQDDPESYLAQLRIDEEEDTPPPKTKPPDLTEFRESEFQSESEPDIPPNIQSDLEEFFPDFGSSNFQESDFPESTFKEQAEQRPSPKPVKRKKNRGDKIVTPTLGEIYAAQGQYAKAIDVFETLLKKHPDNDFYLKKIALLERKLAEAKDASKN